MIEFLIALLLTISTGGNACELGQSVDWYEWGYSHTHADVVFTLESDKGDYWLYQDGDEYLLFVFREDISDVLASGRNDPHGKCAVVVSVDHA